MGENIANDITDENFPVAQSVKKLPGMKETRVQSVDRKISWRKWKATHSGILAQGLPWTEEPGGLQLRV